MAQLFYAVAGEGNGHAIRSSTIIEELKKKHTVHIFSHGKGYNFLKKHYFVTRILGFHMYYVNNTVSSFLTGIVNILKFPWMFCASLKYPYYFFKERPTVVITDFEPFLLYWSKLFSVPCISIDNQHSITETAVDNVPEQFIARLYSKTVIQLFLRNPTHILLTTFFPEKAKQQKTVLVLPIIRKEVLKTKPAHVGHILVYQTSQSYKKMFPVLKSIPKQFIVYGFNKELIEDNIIFKRFNTQNYIEDVRTADAVIINGGFSVLSEALYLQKPVFAIPIRRQYEQILNGYYLQKLGYGVSVKNISIENFTQFLKNKKVYEKNIKKMKWDNNKKLFETLEKLIPN
ncbi:MAG: MJ1255/VC2487 family glycosyltransferase [Candidatus Woesearchaeota archaeon]|jgi:uncharacterized protein (TIGR00661 family)